MFEDRFRETRFPAVSGGMFGQNRQYQQILTRLRRITVPETALLLRLPRRIGIPWEQTNLNARPNLCRRPPTFRTEMSFRLRH